MVEAALRSQDDLSATRTDPWTPPRAPLEMPRQELRHAPDRVGGRPAPRSAVAARAAAIGFATLAATFGGMVFASAVSEDGFGAFDIVRTILIVASTWWLAMGATQAMTGVFTRSARRARARSAKGTGVVLIPVCGEEPAETWARIAAMEISLTRTAGAEGIDIAVLSDTRDDAVAAAELHWHGRLIAGSSGGRGLYYRRRTGHGGKKAGNIAEFIRERGARYDYAVVLDSDSLMEGETIVEMIARMEAAPRLGLLQTVPRVIRGRSRFGRATQFASALHGPVFARGLDAGQGDTGPFWGHNAVFRVRAFAQSCGLPELSGKPPFGGDVLSHDYVEAAFLARAGWDVRLDTDLGGSYEEGPQTLIEHARRDRRWCQGNLQHARLIGVAGLRPWSRFVFVQGMLSYIAPLFWLGFLAAGIAAPVLDPDPGCGLICDGAALQTVALALGVVGLLFLPKALIVAEAVRRGETQGFGGRLAVVRSAMAEIALSSLVAPVLLAWQARSVIEVLTGRDGGWPTRPAGSESGLAEAWSASRWIVLCGTAILLAAASVAPLLALWLLPIAGPMIAAPAIVAWSAREGDATLWRTSDETAPVGIVALHEDILVRWQGSAGRNGPDREWEGAAAEV